MKSYQAGTVFALLAALWNASVGILSKDIFQYDIPPVSVAFYKCLLALLVLSVLIVCDRNKLNQVAQLAKSLPQIIACSFCGIFVLYFFETKAYEFTTVSMVVFVLLGTSAVTSFAFSSYLLKEGKNLHQIAGLCIALMGLGIMYWSNLQQGHPQGIVLAGIAGGGYGLFLVLVKKFNFDATIALLWWLLAFGCLFLLGPFLASGPTLPALRMYPSLLVLALLPTIGGFYCTTKALTLLDASKVQVIELSEPLFASLLAFIFLREVLQVNEATGGILILFAIYISNRSFEYVIARENGIAPLRDDSNG
ncbi:DMT family transporter [Geobacter sp. SVR]|uniref:DMT family transporter n=1 Tax=Geobacter sp. SVR TaxID=2495594 RepID=UPI00143F001D|nr:DMT family transporter [Geobacter sp. SVR]BCS54933.1 permease [Geobacter sp. SVR]GCF86131.1 permease [Geobacter sp. SVR]